MKLPNCFSGYGHNWVEVSTIGEAAAGMYKWLCPRCDTIVTVDERERLKCGQRTGYQSPPKIE